EDRAPAIRQLPPRGGNANEEGCWTIPECIIQRGNNWNVTAESQYGLGGTASRSGIDDRDDPLRRVPDTGVRSLRGRGSELPLRECYEPHAATRRRQLGFLEESCPRAGSDVPVEVSPPLPSRFASVVPAPSAIFCLSAASRISASMVPAPFSSCLN